MTLQFLLLGFLLCNLAWADFGPFSDSGISGPDYGDILASMERTASQYPDLVRVVEYGASTEARPLRMLVVMKNTAARPGGRPTLLMTGSTHGNEYLHIEDRLPSALLQRSKVPGSPVARFLEGGGAFVFVPIVNPDGYMARSRLNARKVDLNRDWDLKIAKYSAFKEIETKRLAQQLDRFYQGADQLRYEITVDYHCCAGALLRPWSHRQGQLPTLDQPRFDAVAQLAFDALKIQIGPTGEVLGYMPKGTSKDYYYSTYGARAFTYEGRVNTESKLFASHVTWWESMASLVADGNRSLALY